MGIKRIIINLVFSISLIWPINGIASWVGPDQLIEGQWGGDEITFGFRSGDIKDQFPYNFIIDSDENVIINDFVNSRIKVYQNNGTLLNIIDEVFTTVQIFNEQTIAGLKWNYKLKKLELGIFNINTLNWILIDGDKSFTYTSKLYVVDDIIFVDIEPNVFYKYSFIENTEKLISKKPIELGKVKTVKTGNEKKYFHSIEFNDYTYKFNSAYGIEKYYRDRLNNFYNVVIHIKDISDITIIAYELFIYNQCDDNEVNFRIPYSQYEKMPLEAENYPTWKPKPIIEYGEPLLSPNGNLYCWARTKTHYKILKWTWQGEPSAPQSFKLKSTGTKMVLSWETPINDLKSVTAYEVSRSSEVCGPYKPIKEVDKNTLSYIDKDVEVGVTYYYQIRAIRDGQYSGYSNKAVGTVE